MIRILFEYFLAGAAWAFGNATVDAAVETVRRARRPKFVDCQECGGSGKVEE